MGRGSASHLPPRAEAALLGADGRSVRTQAPVEDQFSERPRLRRRARPGCERISRRRQIQRCDDPLQGPQQALRDRSIRHFRPIRHEDVQRMATLRRSPIDRQLPRMRATFLTAFMLHCRRLLRSKHLPQSAPLREREPPEQHRHNERDADSVERAERVQSDGWIARDRDADKAGAVGQSHQIESSLMR